MLARLARRLLRSGGVDVRRSLGRDLHLPSLHLPDLHLRDLHWEDIAALAKGERNAREHRSGVILPTMLTLAGAGATFFWWRQWAQGRAESEAAAVGSGEAPSQDVGRTPRASLDADLAVLGVAEEAASIPQVRDRA